MVDSNDPHDVYGLAALLNPDRIGPQASQVERSFIGQQEQTAAASAPPVSATDEFKRRMEEIERTLNMQICPDSSAGSRDRDFDFVDRDDHDDHDDRDHDHDDDRDHDDDDRDRDRDHAPSAFGSSTSSAQRSQIHLSEEGMHYTEEAAKSRKVSSVLDASGINPDGYLLSAHENDEKLILIEEINDLVELFKDAGEDVSNIRVPTLTDSIETIRSTLQSLLIRNDRKRYGSLADDCIMLAATSLAQIFNGQRDWFGFRPDLTGWPNLLRPKLRRMRHDTSQVTSSLLNNYHIGVGGRILLELVPSMVSYARDHSGSGQQGAKSTTGQEADFAGALDRLS